MMVATQDASSSMNVFAPLILDCAFAQYLYVGVASEQNNRQRHFIHLLRVHRAMLQHLIHSRTAQRNAEFLRGDIQASSCSYFPDGCCCSAVLELIPSIGCDLSTLALTIRG